MNRSQSPAIETPLQMTIAIRWVPDLKADCESGRASSLDVLNSIAIIDMAA